MSAKTWWAKQPLWKKSVVLLGIILEAPGPPCVNSVAVKPSVFAEEQIQPTQQAVNLQEE